MFERNLLTLSIFIVSKQRKNKRQLIQKFYHVEAIISPDRRRHLKTDLRLFPRIYGFQASGETPFCCAFSVLLPSLRLHSPFRRSFHSPFLQVLAACQLFPSLFRFIARLEKLREEKLAPRPIQKASSQRWHATNTRKKRVDSTRLPSPTLFTRRCSSKNLPLSPQTKPGRKSWLMIFANERARRDSANRGNSFNETSRRRYRETVSKGIIRPRADRAARAKASRR